jgi:Ca2+-dependent lipid-binding protein
MSLTVFPVFTSLTDMLEDVMQASMPKAINTVRITDMSQGTHPLRIISIRPLDDAETRESPEHARDKDPVDEALSNDKEKEKETASKYVNLEIAFAYRALPIKGNKIYSKAKNMHILIDFGLGMQGVFGKSFPIWVEIRGEHFFRLRAIWWAG